MYNDNLDKEKITGGIVGIWAKMCTDSLLMHKLFGKGQESFMRTLDDGVYLISRTQRISYFVFRLPGETLAAPR